tara:strand:+ start:5400 stop:6170 length:771 start_codon:yes stop_codon:yes gene_type:complete
MPFVIANHQRIHYETAGERGPYLFLHGPFLVNLDIWWQTGYIEQLQETFRLVVIEPLGQGRSDAPLESEHYSISARAAHVLEVLREVQVDYIHFLGFGLGAQVGFSLAVSHPESIRTLAAAGAHPYPLIDELQVLEESRSQLRDGHIAAYLQQWRSEEHLSSEQQQQIANGNPEVYSISLTESCRWEGASEQLNSIRVSTQLFTATSEPRFLSVREAGRQLPNGRYTILPKIQYTHGLWHPDLILSPLQEFYRRQR